ncbi:hypothetical protein GS500_05635 [Rhodococcus hoagii]|nr:hypothetical protein [Prescottella equi]
MFVDYIDGDWAPTTNSASRSWCAITSSAASTTCDGICVPWRAARPGALIHQLPVDGEFTLAAGRGIWGFPKIMADFRVPTRQRRPQRQSQPGRAPHRGTHRQAGHPDARPRDQHLARRLLPPRRRHPAHLVGHEPARSPDAIGGEPN